MIRTALGTAKAKASGTILQSAAAISLALDDCLIVGVGFQQQTIPSSVKWGARELNKSASQINSTSGHGAGLWILRGAANADSRLVTATWSSAIGARALFTLKLDASTIRDQFATAAQTATSSPAAGPTSALDFADDIAIAILCSQGPNSDTPPTASGWTAGQADGTVGAPPISNITVREFYKQIDADRSAVTISGSGATARDFANCIVTYRKILELQPTDANGCEIVAGDTVTYQGTESTVSAIVRERGIPVLMVELADGRRIFSYLVELV